MGDWFYTTHESLDATSAGPAELILLFHRRCGLHPHPGQLVALYPPLLCRQHNLNTD